MTITLNPDFTAMVRPAMGEQRYERFLASFDETPSVSIRTNPFKCNGKTEGEQVPWCKEGRWLAERPAFTFDPLLHAGVYYVQEAASMFIDLVVRQLVKVPVTALDMCAAPGGKSTVLRSALPEGSLLFSNEPPGPRARVLAENIQKWGHPDTVVTAAMPEDYRKSGLKFDLILTDVPCSGEGMFRKEEEARSQWTPALVDSCQRLQRSIVEEAWQCLKPGGILVYSTCTFNTKEDEENALWIRHELGGESLEVTTDPQWNITPALITGEALPVYRFIPGTSRSEGLFVCIFRKPGDDSCTDKGASRKKKKDKKQKPQAKPKDIPTWLCQQTNYAIHAEEDTLKAIPKGWDEIYNQAKAHLRILHAGITLGTFKGKSLIPHPSLALSTARLDSAFPRVDVDYPTAIAYLRGEAICLSPDTPRGFTLVCYGGYPLGFAKNIGSRANNLFPQEWKIKSTHVPTTPPSTGISTDNKTPKQA